MVLSTTRREKNGQRISNQKPDFVQRPNQRLLYLGVRLTDDRRAGGDNRVKTRSDAHDMFPQGLADPSLGYITFDRPFVDLKAGNHGKTGNRSSGPQNFQPENGSGKIMSSFPDLFDVLGCR